MQNKMHNIVLYGASGWTLFAYINRIKQSVLVGLTKWGYLGNRYLISLHQTINRTLCCFWSLKQTCNVDLGIDN